MTDKETYLEQKKTYEQLLMRMQENIEKQKVAVSKMAQVELPEVDGFEMLEGQMKLQKLNKEIVDEYKDALSDVQEEMLQCISQKLQMENV